MWARPAWYALRHRFRIIGTEHPGAVYDARAGGIVYQRGELPLWRRLVRAVRTWGLRNVFPLWCFGCRDFASSIILSWEGWRRGWRCLGCLYADAERECTTPGHGHATAPGER